MKIKTQRNPKGKKTKLEGEIVEAEGKENKEKFKGPAFEIQEYDFSEVHEASSDRFRSTTDLYDKYKKDKDISLKESLKLY